MGEKTITRDELDAAIEATQNVSYSEYNLAKIAVLKAFEAAGFTVEPEPILLDVSDGDWTSYHWNNPAIPSQVRTVIDGLDVVIVESVPCHGDADVMAGSKRLVELVAVLLHGEGIRYASFKSKTDVIDQLEKMDVDVSKFKALNHLPYKVGDSTISG